MHCQLFCDPDAGVGKPLDYFVLEEDCHYSVTWPSKYGCPVSAGWWPRGNAAALLTYASTGPNLRPSSPPGAHLCMHRRESGVGRWN